MSYFGRDSMRRSRSPDRPRSRSIRARHSSGRDQRSDVSNERQRSQSPTSYARSDRSSSRSGNRRDKSPYQRLWRSGTSSSVSTDLPTQVNIPPTGKPLGGRDIKPNNTVGKPVTIRTNHFRVQSLPSEDTNVYEYSLEFHIPRSSQRRGTSTATKQQLARAFVKLQTSSLFGPEFVFDNVSLAWGTRELMKIGETRTVIYDMEGHSPDRPNQIVVRVRAEKTLNMEPLLEWLRAGNVGLAPTRPEVSSLINALNAIFRDFPARRKGWVTRPNSSAFFHRVPELTFSLPSTGGILEAIHGVHQAVSVSFGGNLCLNVDNACGAFYTPGLSLLQVAKTMAGIPPTCDVNYSNMKQFRSGCEQLIGVFFAIRHTERARKEESEQAALPVGLQTRKSIRVLRITQTDANSTIFQRKNATTGETSEISVAEYYKEKYGQIKNLHLPLIETARDGYFPLEVCFTPEGERYKEPLQGQETADFIKVCTAPATVRERQIKEHLKRLQWHKQPLLQSIGLSVETSMLKLQARMLPAPSPQYPKGSDYQPPKMGFWNLKSKTLASCSRFESWGLLYFPGHRQVPEDEAINFCRKFVDCCQQYGLGTPKDRPVTTIGNLQRSMQDTISELSSKICSTFQAKRPGLILVLLHQNASTEIYKSIKNVCEIDGIPSQAMLVEKSVWSQKGQPQYMANVALKVNVKLGGYNHFVPEEKLFARPIMMIGADISHPSPKELRELAPPPSYAAVVASYDRYCTRYTAVTSALQTTEHIIKNLEILVTELIERFHTKVGRYPERIIYWRDGLAETQIDSFVKDELSAFKAIREKKGLKFALTAVNCIKRHKTRFFPESQADSDRLGNVLPCTVAENSVLSNDFYTVTQAALQGCCVPTHYVTIIDENKLEAGDMQRLVVNSCFAYQRATRSIKVVPPVYYAHQVAARAKMHLRSSPGGPTVLHDVGPELTFTMVSDIDARLSRITSLTTIVLAIVRLFLGELEIKQWLSSGAMLNH